MGEGEGAGLGLCQNNSWRKARVSSVTHPPQAFLERIMSDALEERDGNVSKGGRNITNLRFADGITEEGQELEAQVEKRYKTCTRYKMEISADKAKLMTNSGNDIQREIKVKGQKLSIVTSFRYLTLEQFFQMMVPNKIFSQGLHKSLQLLQS